MSDYLKPMEFAEKFNLSQQTVNDWIREGYLKAIVFKRNTKNHYRIPISEVERFESSLNVQNSLSD